MSDEFKGKVLDTGCGTGDNAIWLANLPNVSEVVAVDFSAEAISICNDRLAKAGPPKAAISFLDQDVFSLPQDMKDFDCWLDSAVFHCIGDDSAQRAYLAAVTPRIKVGGKIIMLVFSDQNGDPWVGPRRISESHARNLWTEAGWSVEKCELNHFYKDVMGRNDGKGGHALLMVATRVGGGL